MVYCVKHELVDEYAGIELFFLNGPWWVGPFS